MRHIFADCTGIGSRVCNVPETAELQGLGCESAAL